MHVVRLLGPVAKIGPAASENQSLREQKPTWPSSFPLEPLVGRHLGAPRERLTGWQRPCRVLGVASWVQQILPLPDSPGPGRGSISYSGWSWNLPPTYFLRMGPFLEHWKRAGRSLPRPALRTLGRGRPGAETARQGEGSDIGPGSGDKFLQITARDLWPQNKATLSAKGSRIWGLGECVNV